MSLCGLMHMFVMKNFKGDLRSNPMFPTPLCHLRGFLSLPLIVSLTDGSETLLQ